MDTTFFCVFNAAKRVLLSSRVTVADGVNQPLTILKVLVGGLAIDSQSGLWIKPLHGNPSVPRLFPFDVIYLDKNCSVLDLIEFVPGADFPAYRAEVASVLILPSPSLRSTQTERGDHLLICHAEEMDTVIARSESKTRASFSAHSRSSLDPDMLDAGSSKRESSQRVATSERVLSIPEAGVGVAGVALVEEITGGPSRLQELPKGSLPQLPIEAISASDVDSAQEPQTPGERLTLERGSADDLNPIPKNVLTALGLASVVKTQEPIKNENSLAGSESGKPEEFAPVISITEVLVEKSRTIEAPTTIGVHGAAQHDYDDADDLFSNWMDRPTLESTSNPHSAGPVAPVPEIMTREAAVDSSREDDSREVIESSDEVTDAAEADSLIPAVAQAEASLVSTEVLVVQSEGGPIHQPYTHASTTEAIIPIAGELGETGSNLEVADPQPQEAKKEISTAESASTALKVAKPTGSSAHAVPLPRPALAATSTAAHYGLFRSTLPTSVLPIATVKDETKAQNAPMVPQAQSKEKPKIATEIDHPPAVETISSEVKPAGAVASAPQKEPPLSEGVSAGSKPATSRVFGDSLFMPRKQADKDSNPGKVTAPAISRRPQIPENFLAADVRRKSVNRTESALTKEKQQSTESLPPISEPVLDRASADAPSLVSDAVDTVQRRLKIGQVKAAEAPFSASEAQVGDVPARVVVRPSERPASHDEEEPHKTAQLSEIEVRMPSTRSLQSAPQVVRPGRAPRPVESNGKAPQPSPSLAQRFRKWLTPEDKTNMDRRRAHRRYVPGMVAHYYTGGAPKPHEIADISMTGFYLLTDDRWMPDTMIQMTLQKPCAKGERKQSITVLSRIVRRGTDGVAAQFVMPESLDPLSHDVQPSQTTDRLALARFI